MRARTALPFASTFALLGGALLTSVLWSHDLPWHETFLNWHYRVAARELAPGALSLAGVLVLVAGGVVVALSGRRRRVLPVVGLVVLSLGAQATAFGLVDARFTYVERFDKMHGAFLRAAFTHRHDFADTMRDYERLANHDELGAYARSKPPGTLAAYFVLVRLSEVHAIADADARLADIARRRASMVSTADAAAVGAWLFPLLTALVVLPLVALGRELGGSRAAGVDAALLWATCPAVLVVTHHTDGSVFPLLTTSACALAAAGVRRNRVRYSAAAGVVLGLAVWCSYGLIVSAGFLVGAQLIALSHGRRPEVASRPFADFLAHVAVVAALFVATAATLTVGGLWPAPVGRYEAAVVYHARWKGGLVGGPWAKEALAEFWAWTGLPLLFVPLARLAVAVVAWLRPPRRLTPATVAAVGALAIQLVVAHQGGTNESARLWLFEIPFFAVTTALALHESVGPRRARGLALLGAVAQVLVTVVVRAHQRW